MHCCSWIQLLMFYLLILHDCIFLLDRAQGHSRCNGIFSLSCCLLVRSGCLLCAALCTLNCVECASCIIDVGLHAVRCIMHLSRGLCMCIILYAVRDDVHPVFLDLTASSRFCQLDVVFFR